MRISRVMSKLKGFVVVVVVVVVVAIGSALVPSELLGDFSSPMVMTVCLGEVSGRQNTISIKTIPP